MEKYEYNSKCKHRTGVRETKEKRLSKCIFTRAMFIIQLFALTMQ